MWKVVCHELRNGYVVKVNQQAVCRKQILLNKPVMYHNLLL